jgi:hypothetical protein
MAFFNLKSDDGRRATEILSRAYTAVCEEVTYL